MKKSYTNKQRAASIRKESKAFLQTNDSFTNFAARVGLGPANLSSASRYDFDFLTRLRIQLEAGYRTSWLVGAAVDMPAEDMTCAGIEFETTLPPEDIDVMQAAILDLQIWEKVCECLRWSRLFGGSLAVMLIDGQDVKTPLRPESIGKDSFKGLMVLDRWMVNPTLNDLVTDMGPSMGLPKFYEVIGDAMVMQGMKIHHTRVVRMEGLPLPHYQRLSENLWGESIIERIHDRLVAFDSATQGAGQLVYKAHLRTYKVKQLRELISMGGKALEGLVKQIEMIRLYQSNEGMTLMDLEDEFEAHQYSFTGLSDVIIQFGQQISGALQIPLIRLFGQSPVGLNSTGESDLRTYYDSIKRQQENKLRRPLNVLLDVVARSVLGRELPKGFKYRFNPLWQMTEKEKAEIGQLVTDTAIKGYEAGIVGAPTVLNELRQNSHVSGLWTNITDEDIKEAENMPPPVELAQQAFENNAAPEPGEEEGAPTQDASSVSVGAIVKFKIPAVGGGSRTVAGTVKRILPDGRVEVKSQADGYFVLRIEELTKDYLVSPGARAILQTTRGKYEVEVKRSLGGNSYEGVVLGGPIAGNVVRGELISGSISLL